MRRQNNGFDMHPTNKKMPLTIWIHTHLLHLINFLSVAFFRYLHCVKLGMGRRDLPFIRTFCLFWTLWTSFPTSLQCSITCWLLQLQQRIPFTLACPNLGGNYNCNGTWSNFYLQRSSFVPSTGVFSRNFFQSWILDIDWSHNGRCGRYV